EVRETGLQYNPKIAQRTAGVEIRAFLQSCSAMDDRSGGRTNLRRPHARLAATYNFNHSHFTRQAGRNSRQQCRSRWTDPGGWRFDSGPACNFWLYFLLFLRVFSKQSPRWLPGAPGGRGVAPIARRARAARDLGASRAAVSTPAPTPRDRK